MSSRFIKHIKDKSNSIVLEKTPMWKRTYDVEGNAPRFDMTCKICGSPMALRHSTIAEDSLDGDDIKFNYMCYKCPCCAWFIRFDVRDDRDYLLKIKEECRGGEKMFVPTVDDWSDESDEIKKRLASLGYW